MHSKPASIKSILSAYRSKGIGRRFAIYILMFSSVITLTITIIQLLYDYRRDISFINRQLLEIQIIYQDTLSTAVWVHNKTGLNLQLDGMMRLPTILYVQVDNELGEKSEHRGTHREQRTLKTSFELSHIHRGKKVFLGKVNVLADLDVIYNRLLRKVVVIFISQGIKTFLVSLFILLLFHLLVGRFLITMAEVAKKVSAGSYRDKLDIGSDDELSDVSASFNDMTGKLVANMEKLEKEVDERCRAQQALEEHKNHLEDSVREKTGDLIRANEVLQSTNKELQVANRAKSEFLASMSHELRTPLNAILGFTQLMDRSLAMPSEEKENLAIIRRSGENLLNLINDVLEMSKIEAGRTVLSEKVFDMHRLLDDLEDMFYLKVREKGLTLHSECAAEVPQYIRTDDGKLRQVLVNLLGNAIKFTKEGRILVQVMNSGEKEQNLRFSISDTGAGIASDEMDSLFDTFVQTESGRKSNEGTGLGLAISRKFIRMMGGDIAVESELGRGTVFRFGIRAEAAEVAEIEGVKPERRAIALEPDQPLYRILIVDDRESNRRLLVRLLKPLGFKLREAQNGREALEIWENWEPHMICMDMRMPVMDGYEATKRIKSETKGNATVIIAVTASVFEEERSVVLSAGCDDFVRKPFKDSEIYEMIRNHLGVQYAYEDAVETAPEADQIADMDVLTHDRLIALPVDLLDHLEDAVIENDPDATDTVIHQIREKDELLASTLAELVKDFRFDILQKVFVTELGRTSSDY
ncbi:ATP-binding protein [Desulfococcaceae bacterium HSG8]|nr:ATP-binding protein [Desulfococcaceae bacterium HSG8]